MGTFRQNTQGPSTLFLLGVFFLVATTFNNCGQTPPQDSVLNQSYEKRIGDTKVLYQNSLDENFCADSSNYTCNHKIYSPHLKNETRLLRIQCYQMKDGKTLCPAGLELQFNTQDAIESCGSNCTDVFDYQDAQCSLVLPNLLGENPINEQGQNVNEALSNAYQGCLDALAKESP